MLLSAILSIFRVKLRKGDELRELEEILNQFLATVGSAIADLREKETAVQEKLDTLIAKLKAGEVGKAELLADLEELRARQQEAREVLGRFRVPGGS